MTDNDVVLPRIVPNAGIGAAYRKKLLSLVRDMQQDIVEKLKAIYYREEPAIVQDAGPADELQKTIDQLSKTWGPRIDRGADELAKWFAQKTRDYHDKRLANILRESGLSVPVQRSKYVDDVYQAVIHEQVGLIRSIGQEHLQEVQGIVMRSVQQGRDLSTLSKQLTERYGVTKRRAVLIARDQNNKATATATKAKGEELGVEEAIWRHSHAGKHPRPSHVAADGERFKLSEGMVLDGVRTWPGMEINCRCGSQLVIKGFKM